MIKIINILICSIFIFTHSVFASKKYSQDAELIKSIQSPEELVLPYLPNTYSVPVTLTGSIAKEMKNVLKKSLIENPLFVESRYHGKNIKLTLSNKNYDAETKNLISGILNPIEMMEVVLKSILKYKEDSNINDILQNTNIITDTTKVNDKTVYDIRISPIGNRFAYSYEDLGAYIRETWLESLFVEIDSANLLANKLFILKNTKTFTSTSTQKPSTIKKGYTYLFGYKKLDEHILPQKLKMFANNKLVLSLETNYRIYKKYIVFDSRKICYNLPNKKISCLNINYGEYGKKNIIHTENTSSKGYTKKLKRASFLATKATNALKNGQIGDAVKTFKEIVSNCPGTPQAIEARKLLEGLPDGI